MLNAENITIRRSPERGHIHHGWLDSFHTFSFGDYEDPRHMGFRTLRVINEDTVDPGEGFGAHPHRDMEIVTYVISGALEHKDSMGHGSVIQPGDVQKFSAGTGVVHSEYNASKTEKVHFLQIWIVPEKKGIKPAYDQLTIGDLKEDNGLTLFASYTETPGAIRMHQDVRIYRGILKKGQNRPFTMKDGRGLWFQMIKGALEIGGQKAEAGDGIAIERTSSIMMKAVTDTEFLLFDLK